MNLSHIAIPYAKALFDLAVERKVLDETVGDMRLIAQTCHENRDLRLVLSSPVVATGKKVKILQLIFEGKISKLTMSFLLIIIRKKREAIIPGLASEFIELYKDFKGILTTYLNTADHISDETRDKLTTLLSVQTGKQIDLVQSIDPELIGGFILRWKDQQYDASILHQIKKLHRDISSINLYMKGY